MSLEKKRVDSSLCGAPPAGVKGIDAAAECWVISLRNTPKTREALASSEKKNGRILLLCRFGGRKHVATLPPAAARDRRARGVI